MNYVLIVTLILLVAAFAIGFYRGLFGLLSGLLSWVIIIGFLYVATPLIEERYMDGAVYQKFYNSVSEHITSGLVQKENQTIDQINEQREEDEDHIPTLTESSILLVFDSELVVHIKSTILIKVLD